MSELTRADEIRIIGWWYLLIGIIVVTIQTVQIFYGIIRFLPFAGFFFELLGLVFIQVSKRYE